MASKFRHVKTDRFLGVNVDCSEQKFLTDEDFISSLKEAIIEWKMVGKRGLWIKVPSSNSTLIPHFIQIGLDFHHAQPGYVMMTMWMCDYLQSHMPDYADHYIGVGGFVVNNNNQLLVVRERHHDQSQLSMWKLPGGHTDKGEDLPQTAEREVLEETGVKCEFVSLIAFRHQHKYRFGCSDIYFVCVMNPLSTVIKPCAIEIEDCRWMNLDDYVTNPEVSEVNKYFVQCYKDWLKHKDQWSIVPKLLPSGIRKVVHNVYSLQEMSTYV